MFNIRDYDPIPKMNWGIDLGPVHVGDDGVSVKDPTKGNNAQDAVAGFIGGGLVAPGTALGDNFRNIQSSQWTEWDNPFTNLAREISGANGGFFNPFDFNKPIFNAVGLGKEADQLDQGWRKTKLWTQDALHSNAKNLAGEITGSNRQRQQQWEEKVKQDATDAQNKYFQEQLGAKQKADIAGSQAAGRNRSPGSRLGKNLNFDIGNADITDYLGL